MKSHFLLYFWQIHSFLFHRRIRSWNPWGGRLDEWRTDGGHAILDPTGQGSRLWRQRIILCKGCGSHRRKMWIKLHEWSPDKVNFKSFFIRTFLGVGDSVKIWPHFSMRVQPFLSTSFLPCLGLVHPRQVGGALPTLFTTFKTPHSNEVKNEVNMVQKEVSSFKRG